MCGIAGILNRDPQQPVPRQLLEQMTDLMAYRGPDERGIHVDGALGLGHRRLSIIDLTSGQQPMIDDRRSRVLSYNGEIYNYRSLRDALPVELKARLRTSSDTEILLEIAQFEDLRWLERLNGMFAFALWDARERRLLLARDRLGVKPLYYVDTGSAFLFASEIKALLLHPAVARRVNEAKLAEFIAFRNIAGEETLFEGIRQVPPGHVMFLEPDDYRPRVARFWNEGIGENESTYCRQDRPHAEQFLEIFESSVGLRLIADVPVGTFNSGGLDSSLVTAVVRSLKPGEIHTFSVGFEESSHDESRYADIVSKRFATNHHALYVDRQTYAAELDNTLWHLEEPINHPHTVQLLLLSKLARQYVTVVLTGEGSDEVFGGYPRYNIALIRQLTRLMPDGGMRLLARSLELLGGRRLVKLAESLAAEETWLAIANARFVPGADLSSLYPGVLPFPVRESIYCTRLPQMDDVLSRLLHYEQRSYLPSLLNRLDKTSMAASIEARVPFLDYRLVEWSYKLSADLKIRRFVNKWLVKAAARKLLPSQIIDRRKVGFDVPIGQWLRDGSALGQRLDMLRDARFRQRGRFDAKVVDRLLDEHVRGRADHTEILWSLLGVEMWQRRFIDIAA